MLLKEIVKGVKKYGNVEISNIARTNEEVQKGTAYFCLTQDKEKAEERCKKAIEDGAAVCFSYFDFGERVLKGNHTRSIFAHACANFYGRACDELKIIGITGTNGKTTTSYLIAEILKRNGKKVGVIGTSGVVFGGKTYDCPLTTPDADFLHKTFSQMRDAGVEYVVMEVSAHAIDQCRIDGIMFEVGVLTNITQDHLDYFKTIDAYAKTKCSFFKPEHMKNAVFCCDDEIVAKFLPKCKVPYKTYGIVSPSDTFAIDIYCSMNGSRFVANVDDSVIEMRTNLVGNYNVYNSLAALTVCNVLGLDDKQLASGLNFVNPVEGRFNVINFDGKHIVVDYAHSPDSLMNILKTARTLTDQKVYVVFGCGGNRDKDKRGKMGHIAESFADYVCLTNDNPRLEKDTDIIADIETGMKKRHFVETDRKAAISKMIALARPGDIVIVAGKGAEKYQEIGLVKYPYNDFDAIYSCIKDINPNFSAKELS